MEDHLPISHVDEDYVVFQLLLANNDFVRHVQDQQPLVFEESVLYVYVGLYYLLGVLFVITIVSGDRHRLELLRAARFQLRN